MPLTPAEQQELAQLEQEEQMAQSLMQAPPVPAPGNLTPEEQAELAMLEQEEAMAQQFMAQNPQPKETPIDREDEADLGFGTRAKYAIEPLESNRRALLIEKFGQENVMEDENGDVFIRQNGEFRPVNASGLSFADVVDFAGATPEMVGAGAGAILGMGVGSIPAAAAGGVAGSAARQGISALLGTPQVAPASERAGELALSGAFSAGGAVVGKGVKTAAKKLFPRFRVDNAFKDTAKKVGIKPTRAQLAGGRDLEVEKALAETPVFGRKVRKIYENQIKEIKDNVSKQVGDFADVDFDRIGAGGAVKERASAINDAIKSKAGQLFDEFAEKGQSVSVPAREFKNSLAKQFQGLGLVNKNGELLEHSAKTGLTETQFNRLQGIANKVLKQIERSGEKLADDVAGYSNSKELLEGAVNFNDPARQMINAADVNTIRKFIDANIKEGAQAGVDDVALIKLREGLMNVTEDMLGAQDKQLKRNFRAARGLWKQYLDNRNILEKELKLTGKKSLSDEKVLDRVFRDRKSVQMLKKVSDPETTKQAGDNFIKNILSKKIGGEDQISARGAINTIRQKREAIKEAIGKESYDKLMANLEYLDRIGKPINPSKTGILELRTALMRGAGLKLNQAGRRKVANLVEDLPENSAKRLNLFGDSTQRGISFDGFAGPKVPYRGPQGERREKSR